MLLAILLACVNTMLMAGREQTHDVGILKALGFEDGSVFGLLLAQSLLLCLLGGGARRRPRAADRAGGWPRPWGPSSPATRSRARRSPWGWG